MLSALIQQSTNFAPAQRFLNQAVAGLRAAGGQDDLPFGLLARAASYSQMPLHLTDYYLEACRNIRQQLNADNPDFVMIERGQRLLPADPLQMDHNRELMIGLMENRFNHHLAAAENLINQTGYHRRDKALKELQNPDNKQRLFIP